MKPTRSAESLKRKASEVNALLTKAYGRKQRTGTEDPLDTLIETILSQNTSDVNSHRAFLSLKRRYPTWEAMLETTPEVVSDVIRSGGLADIKAQRILTVLRLLASERGELDLRFLSCMTPEEANRWLTSIDGIGPKTSAIVLLFSFGMPAFPVDTHIHRVTRRMGLIADGVSREKAQIELGFIVPKEEYHNMHLNLIEHGRRTCKPRSPRCGTCVVSGNCRYHLRRSRTQA